jgi:CCR4-NOT transcription complex subunit 3
MHQRLLQEQQARAQAEQMRLQQLQRQQQEQMRQQELLRQQQQQQQQQQQAAALAAAQAEAQQKAQQVALQRQQQQQIQEQQRQQAAVQQETKQSQLQAQQASQLQQASQQALHQQRSRQGSSTVSGGAALDALLTSGLGGLSLGAVDNSSTNQSISVSPQQQVVSAVVGTPTSSSPYDASASYLSALHESYRHCPSTADSERQKSYIPRNPYPTPSTYPTVPSATFDNPAIFEKLGTDALFFIFYYSQGTYQQYLAARELKKQSWRYHKKYMTWFQRHEEPKITTDEYEQGTYVYFDYETGWCQRIKADFRFEYAYLEDSLSI